MKRGYVPKSGTQRLFRTAGVRDKAATCPLWVISGQALRSQNPTLSALVQKRTKLMRRDERR